MTSFIIFLELMGYTVQPWNSQRDYIPACPGRPQDLIVELDDVAGAALISLLPTQLWSWTSSQHWADSLPSTIDGSFVNWCVLVCACWNQSMLTSSVQIKDTNSPLLSNHYKQWNQSFSVNTSFIHQLSESCHAGYSVLGNISDMPQLILTPLMLDVTSFSGLTLKSDCIIFTAHVEYLTLVHSCFAFIPLNPFHSHAHN